MVKKEVQLQNRSEAELAKAVHTLWTKSAICTVFLPTPESRSATIVQKTRSVRLLSEEKTGCFRILPRAQRQARCFIHWSLVQKWTVWMRRIIFSGYSVPLILSCLMKKLDTILRGLFQASFFFAIWRGIIGRVQIICPLQSRTRISLHQGSFQIYKSLLSWYCKKTS